MKGNNAAAGLLIVAAGVGYYYREDLLKQLGLTTTATVPPGSTGQAPAPTDPIVTSQTPPAPIVAALPITVPILRKASYDTDTAKLLGNDPRALLTADQWNYYLLEAKGIKTTDDLFTPGNREEKITAMDYQRRRDAAGLPR